MVDSAATNYTVNRLVLMEVGGLVSGDAKPSSQISGKCFNQEGIGVLKKTTFRA